MTKILEALIQDMTNLQELINQANSTKSELKTRLKKSFLDPSENANEITVELAVYEIRLKTLNESLEVAKFEIELEEIAIVKAATKARRDVRVAHIKSGIEKLETARPVAAKLSGMIKEILEHSKLSGEGVGNELTDASREILGSIINANNFQASSLRATGHINKLTVVDDFERLQSNLRGDI